MSDTERVQPLPDDTEGHGRVFEQPHDDDTEGHGRVFGQPQDDDTEGHRYSGF